MKTKLKIAAALVVIGASIGNINANTVITNVITEYADNWVLVKSENGVKTYISQYVNVDETLALKVKFENSTNQKVELNWSLVNKTTNVSISENQSIVDAKSSFVFMDDQNHIPVNFGETINDLSIIFK